VRGIALNRAWPAVRSPLVYIDAPLAEVALVAVQARSRGLLAAFELSLASPNGIWSLET